MAERRICTKCLGDRCWSPDGVKVELCPTCKGDGFELLSAPAQRLDEVGPQRRIWYQLDLPLETERRS